MNSLCSASVITRCWGPLKNRGLVPPAAAVGTISVPKDSTTRCKGSPRRWQLHGRVLLGKKPPLISQIGLKGPSMHAAFESKPDTGE